MHPKCVLLLSNFDTVIRTYLPRDLLRANEHKRAASMTALPPIVSWLALDAVVDPVLAVHQWARQAWHQALRDAGAPHNGASIAEWCYRAAPCGTPAGGLWQAYGVAYWANHCLTFRDAGAQFYEGRCWERYTGGTTDGLDQLLSYVTHAHRN